MTGPAISRPRADAPLDAQVAFGAHIQLLRQFLARRAAVVERIEALLNAQRRPAEYLHDRPRLSRFVEDAFFAGGAVTEQDAPLRGQLDDAYQASGFRARRMPALYNGLIDPGELMVRVFHLWQQTRWPGRNGRLRFAHTLFDLYVIRSLELLTFRLWDPGDDPGERLSRLQDVLTGLWKGSPSDHPLLVRDARWLLPLAQSPATDDLSAYFDVARRVATSLPEADRIEVHKAGVRMAGGHLRSQIRHFSTQRGAPFDEPAIVVDTRTTNALDFALLIQELVPLLEAYEHAATTGDRERRLDLADAICQGLSPDPELFVNRVDLLGPYCTIEPLFVTIEDGARAEYSAIGRRHADLVDAYAAAIGRVAPRLLDDCARFRPTAGAYSPYGVLYGFSSNLLEHMALKAVQPDAETRFALEDVFTAGDAESGKLEWVTGWRRLPHLTQDVHARFAYPQTFAEDIFRRTEDALRRRVANGSPTVARGRLYVHPANGRLSPAPTLPRRYVSSSDAQLVASGEADRRDDTQMLDDRREGRALVGSQTAGGWLAISKAVLTEIVGEGHSATLPPLPTATVSALILLCPTFVVLPENGAEAAASC